MQNWNVNTVYGSKAGAVGSINTNKDMPDSVKASILSLVAGLPEPAPAYAANILVATSGNHEIGGAQVVNGVNITLTPNAFYNVWVGYSNQPASVA